MIDKEKRRLSSQRWARENRERKQAQARAWGARNREKQAAYNRKWRDENREQHLELARHLQRKCKYGITKEQYQELVDAANGKCPICKRKFTKRIVVDHCHKTGIVRGVICNRCNSAEGNLGSPAAALRLYQYMLKNELFYQGGS